MAATSPAADDVDLTELPDAFLMCRDLRHSWKRCAYWRTPYGEERRGLVCGTCGTVRIDRRDGSHIYQHPEGYRLPHRVAASDVRDEAFSRAQPYRDEEAAMKALIGGRHGGVKKPRSGTVIDLTQTAQRRSQRAPASRRKAVSA